jgi:hypothetical protein
VDKLENRCLVCRRILVENVAAKVVVYGYLNCRRRFGL